MPEKSIGQSTLERYKGKILPIYVLCEFNDLDDPPVLGKVNPNTYKVAERSIRDELRTIAHRHYVLHQRHTDYSLAVILGNRNSPDEIIILQDTFPF